MARLVYIQQIWADTFLHFSRTQASFRLRHYPNAEQVEEIMRQGEDPDHWYADDIIRLARQQGNHIVTPENASELTDTRFWHNYLQQLNRQYRIGVVQPPVDPLQQFRDSTTRVQSHFAVADVSGQ